MLEASPQNSSQANVPRDLASAVHEELRRRSIIDPSLETLTELFDAMFFASLQTEESHRVVFEVVYIDPNSPDPKPPKNPPHGEIGVGTSPEGHALKFVHRGSYDGLDNTYEAITNYLDERRLEAKDMFIEQYLTDPLTTNEDHLVVDVYVVIK